MCSGGKEKDNADSLWSIPEDQLSRTMKCILSVCIVGTCEIYQYTYGNSELLHQNRQTWSMAPPTAMQRSILTWEELNERT